MAKGGKIQVREWYEGEYWREEEERKCRVCGGGKETWEHVWEECMKWGHERGWQKVVGEVLGQSGEGEGWIRELERIRKKESNEEREKEEWGRGKGWRVSRGEGRGSERIEGE